MWDFGKPSSAAQLGILGNNSISLSLPASSVQWVSQARLPQRVAVRIRQGDVGKEPDMEGCQGLATGGGVCGTLSGPS